MIFYFSGTGNSEYAAKRIAEVLGEPAVGFYDKIKEKERAEVTGGGMDSTGQI